MKYRTILKKTTWLFIGMILFFTFFSKTISNMNMPRVKTIEPENGYLIKTVRGKGFVAPENSLRLYLPVSCIIDKLLVVPGESVLEGTPLLVLNSAMIQSVWEKSYSEYCERQLELEQENEALHPIKIPAYNLEILEKQFKAAVEDKAIKEELYRQGCLSRKELEEAGILVDAAEAEYRAAVDNGAEAERNEAIRIRNVERRISFLEMEIENMTKNIGTIKGLKQNPVFLSPSEGTIVDLLCSEGSLSHVDEAVLILSGGTSFCFNAEIDRALGEDLSLGSNASIFLDGGSEYTGSLKSIAPGSDGKTYALIFSVDGRPEPGASGFFFVRKKSPYYDLIIPERAMRGTGSSRFVYVIDEKNGALSDSKIIRKYSIRLLDSGDQRAAVSGDLSETSRIVYDEDRRTLSENAEVIVE